MTTDTQTNKEKQHYVPKFFLKRFSYLQDQKNIGVYNPGSGLYVPRAPLRTQAYDSYFYGRDGVLEDALSRIEGTTAEALRQAAATDKQIVKRSPLYYELMLHILLSSMRTAGHIANSKQHLNSVHDIGFEGRPLPIEAPLLQASQEQAIQVTMEMLQPMLELSSDLEIKLVKNYTGTPFITCDDPVLRYNQLLEKHNIPAGITGTAHAGLQFFLPIDPQTLLVAYDSRHYKVGSRKGNPLVCCTSEDVDELNMLAMLSYKKTIFFDHQVTREYLAQLAERSRKFEKGGQTVSNKYYKVGQKNGEFIYHIEEPEDYESFIIASYITPLKTKLCLSFIRYTREAARFVPYKIPGNMRPHCAEIHRRDRQLRPRQPYKFTYPENFQSKAPLLDRIEESKFDFAT